MTVSEGRGGEGVCDNGGLSYISIHGVGGAWESSVADTSFHEQEYDTPSSAAVSRHTQWATDLGQWVCSHMWMYAHI